MKLCKYLTFLTFFVFCYSHAVEEHIDSSDVVNLECSIAISGDSQDLLDAGFAGPLEKYGKRGLLGFQPEVNSDTLDVAGKYAIIRGEATIIEAKDLNQVNEKGPANGLYFFKNQEEEKSLQDYSLTIVKDGKIVKELSREQTWRILDITQVTFHEAEKNALPYYSTEGWIQPEERTIINREISISQGGSTYGDIRKFTKTALNSGYKIVFNQQPKVAVSLSRKHTGALIQESNKSIAIGTYVKGLVGLINQNHAFTIEVYGPHSEASSHGEGGLIAGVIGHIQGKLYVIDTVFYPPVDGGEKYEKSAIFALLDRLFYPKSDKGEQLPLEEAIDFVDTTKISGFAKKHLRALTITSETEIDLISNLPDAYFIDLKPFSCSNKCD